MTWEAEIALLRNPLIDNWDFAAAPVAWPGQEFSPPAKTGDRSDPAIWLDFDVDYAASEYLDSGSNAMWLHGALDCAIMVEPIIGHDLIHRQKADLMETYFLAANSGSINFRTFESDLSEVFIWEGDWLRADWFCPFWRFDTIGGAVARTWEDGTPRTTEDGTPRTTEG